MLPTQASVRKANEKKEAPLRWQDNNEHAKAGIRIVPSNLTGFGFATDTGPAIPQGRARGRTPPNHEGEDLVIPDLLTAQPLVSQARIRPYSDVRKHTDHTSDAKRRYDLGVDRRIQLYMETNEVPALRLADLRRKEKGTRGFGNTKKRYERRRSSDNSAAARKMAARRKNNNMRRPPPPHISKFNTKLLAEAKWVNRRKTRPRIKLVPGAGNAVPPKQYVTKEFFAQDLPFVPVPPPESRRRFRKPPNESYRRNKAYESALQKSRETDEGSFYSLEKNPTVQVSEYHAQQLTEEELLAHVNDVLEQNELRHKREQREQEDLEEVQARLFPESTCQHEGFSPSEAKHVQKLAKMAIGQNEHTSSPIYLASSRGVQHRSTTFSSTVPIGSANTCAKEEERQAALLSGTRTRAKDGRVGTGSAADQRRYLRQNMGLQPLPEPRRRARNRF
jgi:hypothetical protein